MKPYYETKLGKLYHGDCLEIMPLLDEKVDMILCDLPYGTTACKWDKIIPFEPLWVQYYRILRPNGFIILIASQPFTSKLVMSNIDNFSHNWVWDKGRGVGHLLANIRPMMITEDILIFSNEFLKHDNTGENPIRKYLISEKKKSGLTNKDFNKLFSAYTNKQGCTNRSVIEHYWGKAQFILPTREIYENILQMTGYFKEPYSFIETGKLYRKTINENLKEKYPRIYNPQMIERDKPRKSANRGITECYGNTNKYDGGILEKRYPTNLISFNKSSHKDMLLHPTQKPVALFEYLIKTYTNEGDTVLDNCAGSGTTAIACENLKRKWICIEKDEENKYCQIAAERIDGLQTTDTILHPNVKRTGLRPFL